MNTRGWLRVVMTMLPPMATIGFMVRDALRDGGPTGLPSDLPNWHNKPGDLKTFVVIVLIEAVVCYRLSRPWAGGVIWRRALATSGVFLAWLLLNMLPLMHAGGIMLIHFIWLIGLVIGSFALFVTTGVRAVIRQRVHRPAATVQ